MPAPKTTPAPKPVAPKPPPAAPVQGAADAGAPEPMKDLAQGLEAAAAATPRGGKTPLLGKDGKVDKRALIEQYRPFVRSIAGKIKKTLAKEIEFDDLMEFGMIGLLEAGDRFDPKFGANFMTFSYYRIRGAIYDGLRQMGWVNRTEYAKLRFEERATAFLQNVADRQAGTIADGKEKTSEDEINALAEQVQNLVTIYVTSLEAMEGLQVEDKEAIPVDNRLADVEMKRHVRDALERMPEQEQKLINLYYFKELSLQEVGDQLGLSKSWTSRLHAKAIEKLGKTLQELTREAVSNNKVGARATNRSSSAAPRPNAPPGPPKPSRP
jgi:RNA polymerase sigma factor for flagellar operon FliA